LELLKDGPGWTRYKSFLSWKKELRMFNWKGIRQISKSQKVKSRKVFFSTFRFFEIQNEAFLLFNFSTFDFLKLKMTPFHFSTFRLFDFSELTMKPLHFSTFYFSNFPVTCSTFSLSFSKLLSAFAMEEHLLRERRVQQKTKVNK